MKRDSSSQTPNRTIGCLVSSRLTDPSWVHPRSIRRVQSRRRRRVRARIRVLKSSLPFSLGAGSIPFLGSLCASVHTPTHPSHCVTSLTSFSYFFRFGAEQDPLRMRQLTHILTMTSRSSPTEILSARRIRTSVLVYWYNLAMQGWLMFSQQDIPDLKEPLLLCG
jgi:hypothetical protein